jgi:hypothetical protein
METPKDQRGQNYAPPPGFPPEERNIFLYFDGVGQRAGDPIELMYRTSAFLPDQFGVLKACHAGEDVEAEWEELDKTRTTPLEKEAADQRRAFRATWAAEQLSGYEQLTTAIRLIFNLAPFDPIQGGGADWKTCLAVWNQFQDWMAAKKKKPEESPTKSPSSAPDGAASTSPTTPTSGSSTSTAAA